MIARMKKTLLLAFGAILGVAAFLPVAASAAYDLDGFDVKFLNADGTPAHQAGSHPYAMTTVFFPNPSEGKPKDVLIEQLTGFVGDGTMPRCSTVDFLAPNPNFANLSNLNLCPDGTAIGVADIGVPDITESVKTAPIFNLAPPSGVAARIGFRIRGIPAMVDVVPKEGDGYNLIAGSRNISAAVSVSKVRVMLWGVPADPRHDFARGNCAKAGGGSESPFDEDFSLVGSAGAETCPTNSLSQPFITLPRSCSTSLGDIETKYETTRWEDPGTVVRGGVFNDTHTFIDEPTDPASPQPFTGCPKLGFDPRITGAATTRAAQSPSGLEFGLHIEDPGLQSVGMNEAGQYEARAESEIKKAVVTLPQGMTANPSLAEGLEVCTEAQLEAETAASPQGAHCPDGAKRARSKSRAR